MSRVTSFIGIALIAFGAVAQFDVPGFCAPARQGQLKLKPLEPIEDTTVQDEIAATFAEAVEKYEQGDLAAAEVLFNKVLKVDKSNADAHFNLGAIREWRKDLQGAMDHYQAALALRPSDREIRDAVASVKQKIQNQAIEELESAKVRKHQELASHGRLAKEAFASQNYPAAVAHLNHLAMAMPQDAKVQFALGQSLRALKNFDWAAYRLKMAIYLDPDNETYRKALVELDSEIETLQDEAIEQSAQLALNKVRPLTFSEAVSSSL